ncbi:ParE toxin of type II toxin-antitoxin system, parDE [Candidatus Gugararchaeum adminiculabundum]|nr:ParE toxin of type II toxin-antitoxin system, parDE [Candidatus Gugararchaeum adminiculabundum]
MNFNILISESANRFLYSLETRMRVRLKEGMRNLKEDPFRGRPGADIKKLASSRDPPFYRLRVGDFRVVYAIEGKDVKITTIIHRSKGYKWLE